MSDIRNKIYIASENFSSKKFLGSILEKISSEKQIIDFTHRYSVFNGDFAGGVANLAGEFHIRGDIFKGDSDIDSINDRSSEIATEIYFAAEDEYADRKFKLRITHRQLAQELLKAVLDYFKIDNASFQRLFPLNEKTKDVIKKVREGYCLNKESSEDDLFRGLGFHIGSELLADQEFNLLDQFLRDNYSDLVKFLENKNTNFDDIKSYRWISLHMVVELEHLSRAFIAAERAIKYYKGKKSEKEVQGLIVKGFLNFAKLQKDFFSNILM
ncbi:hypothetical protein HY061_00435 [Candidatus Azambacteria bacterium]|nr:hypothetical protein [Candidatus Azambacteria bacterium]